MQRLGSRLPQDVASLLGVGGAAAPTFTEEAMAKARGILNHMIEQAYAELDNTLIECKAFENMNRMSFGQVRTDLNRMGAEMAETEEHISENLNCMFTQDGQYKTVSQSLNEAQTSYERVRAQNQEELRTRKNDLAVFDAILDLTKCTSLLLLQKSRSNTSSSNVRVCGSDAGFDLEFVDMHVQRRLKTMMTPRAKSAMDAALGRSFGKLATAFVQVGTPKPTAVREEPPQSTQWKKCTNGSPDCGLLHDTMAVQWGKFKDLVDELEAEMDRDKDAWTAFRADLNEQLDVVAGLKGDCQTKFDAATGKKNMITTESEEKSVQMRELTVDYEHQMGICHSRVAELMYTDVCAARKVRNEVLSSSKESPPEKISDCEVSNWVGEECSVQCDNSCPHKIGGKLDPYGCGGTKTLRRSVVISANKYGVKCPQLKRDTRCGQYKCPVDCKMSEWSGWSKCTKECGGGARQRTRSVLQKPNHGGRVCDTPVEAEACGTGSCDRDCALGEWTEWSFCSMACNPGTMPGFQERVRKVVLPIRGNGMCPAEWSAKRLERQTCNPQPCHGDEICVAKQDLIIALDASGSLREKGFEILRDFAVNLTGSYKTQYYGAGSARIGVILFGNGARLSGGGITPAINVIGLTTDLDAVRKQLKEQKWQKGFTNMAQAFTLADSMFQLGGRKDAQSSVLVLSDGRYSFAFQTKEAVDQLKAKGVFVHFAPVAERQGSWQHKLKQWASAPWETNYELLPGLDTVKANMGMFSAALVAKFCPDALSPTAQALKDDQRGFALIHEGGFPSDECGKWYDMGNVESSEECARKSRREKKTLAFAVTDEMPWFYGKRHCYAEAIEVTTEKWKLWLKERANVPCKGGAWLEAPFYSTYAMEP